MTTHLDEYRELAPARRRLFPFCEVNALCEWLFGPSVVGWTGAHRRLRISTRPYFDAPSGGYGYFCLNGEFGADSGNRSYGQEAPQLALCPVEIIHLTIPTQFVSEGEMDWLEHTLRESPYLCGAIAYVVTFVLLVVRSKPVPTETSLVASVGFSMLAAFEVMHSWPPALVQSEILVGTVLAGFLLGLMLSRLGSITFDTATHEFFIEQSVSRSALIALFAGVFVALMPLLEDTVGRGNPAIAAWCAWMAGGALGHWRRMVRAGGA